MMRIIISFLLAILPLSGFSQSQDLNASLIKENLRNNASAVLRYENTEFEIKADDKASMRVDYAITILNDNGIKYSYLVVPYNEFSKVSSISATIYDADGEKVKRIPKSDILDISAISGFSLYEDSRIKAIDPEYRVTPFTVVYSYELDFSGTLNLPAWQPYKGMNVSVEKASFMLSYPIDYSLRYFEKNISFAPEKGTENDMNWIQWQTGNLEALMDENFSSPDHDILPKVYTAPSGFSLDGYHGDMTSWEGFGKWVYKLLEGTNDLPEETKIEIQNLTADIDDDKQKVEKLYSYLQQKTRYVSIQAGIGGWKPFDASVVDEYSYGDCKALSNYMISVLEAAGIKAFYTLVKAGSEKPEMIENFPSNQFNHAIVMVPLADDSLWLECTSQKIAFNYLGTFTDDRKVLLITEEGGKLAKTPVYDANQNKKVTHTRIKLNGTDAVAEVEMKNSGLFYEMMSRLENMDAQKRHRALKQQFDIPALEISAFEAYFPEYNKPVYTMKMELQVRELSSKMRGRIIVPIKNVSTEIEVASQRYDRRSEIYIPRSYSLIDTVEYEYPAGYVLGTCPDNVSLNTAYGIFQLNFIQDERKLVYVRQMTINKGVYPGSGYAAFTEFLDGIENANNLKFLLKEEEL